jgi:leucyl aminopeptidase
MTKGNDVMSSLLKISFETSQGRGKADVHVCLMVEGPMPPALKKLDQKTQGALSRAIKAEDFKGKKGESVKISGVAGLQAAHLFVMGAGPAEKIDAAAFEKLGSMLVTAMKTRKITQAVVDLTLDSKKTPAGFHAGDAAARFALGMTLNNYAFTTYLHKKKADAGKAVQSAVIVTSDAKAARKAYATVSALAEGVYATRDLVSEPPNVLYPESFADRIRKTLAPLGIEVKVLHAKDIQKLGMGALMAVGQGSVREPKLVTMQYKGGAKNDAPVAFVGKGVTFDTGGISIKPAQGMEDMKWDMAGAGAVVGAMKTLALRKAKANVVGVVALAENMPSGNACRPGDIVSTMSGQTVEIQNTDAEGRLILCDALWYCQQTFKPKKIIDLATLTGAVIVALGAEYAGMFSNNDDFARDLVSCGNETGDHLWRLPLNDAWDKAIDTPQADMKNIAGNRDAGSAIGAHFLKRFIQKDVTWAHLDIAGMAWTSRDKTSTPKGATAFGVRLLDHYISSKVEK